MAFRLVFALIENENREVLQEMLVLVKEDSFHLLTIIRNRIQNCVDHLIVKEEPKPSKHSQTTF